MIRIDAVVIAELASIPWFENCGKPANSLSVPTRQLNDWSEVRAAAAEPDWINSTEEAHGRLTEYLSSRHPNDYQGIWNRLIREARGQIDSSAGAKAEAVAAKHDLGQAFIDAVKWDVLNGVMEVSYKSKDPPNFFDRLLEVYQAGHYPCGVEGDGTLVIF